MVVSNPKYIVGVVFLVLMLFASSAVAATQVQVTVDKNPVLVGEPLVVTVEVNEHLPRDAFDFGTIFANYNVGRTAVSHQRSVINGTATATTTFRVILTATQAGQYEIPALEWQGARSKPIAIAVVQERGEAEQRRGVAFLTGSVDSQTVYLQQQFNYVAKLYLAADLSSGNLAPPEFEGADVIQVGQDQESYEMVDGRRYRVYQRQYAITPNRSGTFNIGGATFSGEVYSNRQDSLFSTFANTTPVAVKAQPIELTVKAVPSDWQGPWLPSELVSLTREFSPSASSGKVGEALTVTYMLTAAGVKPEQLPPLQFADIDGVRSYPEQPQTDTFVRNGTSIAQQTVKVTLIPTQPGTLTIPAYQLNWFNTRLNSPQQINLPSQTLTITGVAMPTETPPSAPSPVSEPSTLPAAEPAQANAATTTAITDSLWFWLALSFALLWIVTVALWLRARRQTGQPQQLVAVEPAPTAVDASEAWREFQQACKHNQAAPALQQLWAWVSATQTPTPIHLNEWAQDNDALLNAIHAAQQSCFADPNKRQPWRAGKALYQAVKRHIVARAQLNSRQKKAPDLPALYGHNTR